MRISPDGNAILSSAYGASEYVVYDTNSLNAIARRTCAAHSSIHKIEFGWASVDDAAFLLGTNDGDVLVMAPDEALHENFKQVEQAREVARSKLASFE